MKNLLFIISIICCISNAKAQSNNNEVMSIYLPNGCERLSKSQYDEFYFTHFSKNFQYDYSDHVFKKDDVLFSYRNIITPVFMVKKQTLESTKNLYTNLISSTGRDKITYAEIVIFNGIKFLIIKYYSGNDYVISFTSDYNTNKSVQGFIEFNGKDESKANGYLNDILAKAHFLLN